MAHSSQTCFGVLVINKAGGLIYHKNYAGESALTPLGITSRAKETRYRGIGSALVQRLPHSRQYIP